MTLKFGTDGVRGVANRELTPELALALGRAAVRVLGGDRWAIGRDPRVSGPMLAAALAAGLASEGADVTDLGVLPTPGVAHTAVQDGVGAAMISASHNPFGDNGIKIFAPGGMKLTDDVEAAIEAELLHLHGGADAGGDDAGGSDPGGSSPTGADRGDSGTTGGDRPVGAEIGRLHVDAEAAERYRTHLRDGILDGRRLDGLRIVLDTANGAASAIAPAVFESLGATITVIHDHPDGVNINDDCGSTHPDALRAAVLDTGADLGLAFDGDADRVLAVDHTGELVDGDQIIAVCAIDLHGRGLLAHDTVVVTVMSNLGFRRGMEARGIRVLDTPVGDRHVLEALETGGFSLGGEQSGHLIFRSHSTTGDGILSGLLLTDLLQRRGRPLAELTADAMTRLPQVLVNVRLDRRDPDLLTTIAPRTAEAEARLGERGRVLLRASGTEPLIRVMVEAPTNDEAREVAEDLAAAVRAAGDTEFDREREPRRR